MSDKTALRRTLETVGLMLIKCSIPLAVFFACAVGPQLMAQQVTPSTSTEYPAEIDWVLVNGVVTIDHGKHTGARAGQIMYGPGHSISASVSAGVSA